MNPFDQVLAVADKLDTLAGILVLGKKPSGNRDPFGLRRAALGAIRLLVECDLDVDLDALIKVVVDAQPDGKTGKDEVCKSLHTFITERLRHYFVDRDPGLETETFEAVVVRRPATLIDFESRLRAVQRFIELEPASSLAAANKRTANILRQAEFEGGADLDTGLLADDAERVLYHAMQSARQDVTPLVEKRAYAESLGRLAELRVPVDAFFDDVMVMTDDEALRNNRLALLAELRSLFLDIADISRLTPAQD